MTTNSSITHNIYVRGECARLSVRTLLIHTTTVLKVVVLGFDHANTISVP